MSKKEVMNVASPEVLSQLSQAYPVEQSGMSIKLPRLGMFSQNQTEGEGVDMKVTVAAGEFYIDSETDEEDEAGKKVWNKELLGKNIEGIIYYKRHQLRLYDEATEKYTSSPIFDTNDEIIPLFCDKKEIARGTPADLKAKYQYTDETTGKVRSHLEDNRILYILYNGESYQVNLRGSSMYSLMTYERSTNVPTVLTAFSSTSEKKGKIAWNKMSFKVVRPISAEEAVIVLEAQNRLKAAIEISKASYTTAKVEAKKADDELDAMAADAAKALN